MPASRERSALCGLLLALSICVPSVGCADSAPGFSILSWNVSRDAFVTHADDFRALLEYTDPDIILLDEVTPKTSAEQLRAVLPPAAEGSIWHIDFGSSGGRQRGVIASRAPLQALPEFDGAVAYPDDAAERLRHRAGSETDTKYLRSIADGVAVNGAIVSIGGLRLLVVIADLECCGDDPAGWEELKRRIEAQVIRQRIRRVVERTDVDGIVLAGDFNLVMTPIPMALMSGPYPGEHAGLIPAEVYHRDSELTWTWDGRKTPFPTRALDFALYSPNALEVVEGLVVDTEDLSAAEAQTLGLSREASIRMSDHRPLLVRYRWR